MDSYVFSKHRSGKGSVVRTVKVPPFQEIPRVGTVSATSCDDFDVSVLAVLAATKPVPVVVQQTERVLASRR